MHIAPRQNPYSQALRKFIERWAMILDYLFNTNCIKATVCAMGGKVTVPSPSSWNGVHVSAGISVFLIAETFMFDKVVR